MPTIDSFAELLGEEEGTVSGLTPTGDPNDPYGEKQTQTWAEQLRSSPWADMIGEGGNTDYHVQIREARDTLLAMLEDPYTYTDTAWYTTVNHMYNQYKGLYGSTSNAAVENMNSYLSSFIKPEVEKYGGTMGQWTAGPVPWSSNYQLFAPQSGVSVDGVGLDDYVSQFEEAADDASDRVRRGGGSSGPKYNAPDRRTVEELARAHLRVKTGNVDEQRVQVLADAYMRDHAADWTSRKGGGPTIDPEQTVIEMIRKQPDYMSIHKFRPETEDEDRWLGAQIAAQKEQGVGAEQSRVRGQLMAQGGGAAGSAQSFLQTQGRSQPFVSRIQSAASHIGNLVR